MLLPTKQRFFLSFLSLFLHLFPEDCNSFRLSLGVKDAADELEDLGRVENFSCQLEHAIFELPQVQ